MVLQPLPQRFPAPSQCACINECVQIVQKRTMPDGRKVSAFWGGAHNPDGTRKKKKALPEQAKGKRKAARTARAASKAEVRGRWVKQKATLEARKQWQGSRCFDKWLLQQGERTLDELAGAEAAAMPQVCHCCAVFADFLGAQKWHVYLAAVESVALGMAKNRAQAKSLLQALQKNFAVTECAENV